MEHGLEDEIIEEGHLLRAAQWQNPEYVGLAIQFADYIFHRNPHLFLELAKRRDIESWLSMNASDLLDEWEGVEDPMLSALAHAVGELDEADGIDLESYRTRIERALPDDPAQAVGATKDMLEAAMRTILEQRDVADPEDLDFPTLTTRCFHELGLASSSKPATDEERLVLKIASGAKNMILAANELRNTAGTGHGRATSRRSSLTSEDARFVAASGFVLTAWLLRRAED